MSSSPNLQSRYEKSLINIKIICTLNPYDRLKFEHEYVRIRPYNIFLGIIRYFSGESRDDIINGINNLYHDLECICNEYLNMTITYDIEDKFKMLLNELSTLYAIDNKGLLALLVTYSIDSTAHSKIEILIEKFKRISLIIEDAINSRTQSVRRTEILRQSRIDRSRSE